MLWYRVSPNHFEGKNIVLVKSIKSDQVTKCRLFVKCSPLNALSSLSPTWAVIQLELMGIIMTTVKVALELMINYWLHLGYFHAYWLILELGERVWLSHCPFFFSLEVPFTQSSDPGESKMWILCCNLGALPLLTLAPLPSQRDLPEWVEDTELQQTALEILMGGG